MPYCCISLAVVSRSFDGFKTSLPQTISHPMNQDLIIDCFEETRKQCGKTIQSCAKPYQLTVEFLASSAIYSQSDNYKDISKTLAAPYTFLDEESSKLYFISYPEFAIGERGTVFYGTYLCRLTPIGSGKTTTTKSINYKSFTFVGSQRMFALLL